MLRVVFFDLGGTLIDADRRPFPHAADALSTISRFTTATSTPLLIALVSDFDMPEPPATPAKTRAIFTRYLAILDGTGLRPLFEPVARRVTLSAHAGVLKPEAAVFHMALKRLRAKVPLSACLLVTENGEHVRAVRRRHQMHALQCASASSSRFDFDDWRQFPALVARVLEPSPGPNTAAALRRFLHVAHAVDAESIEVEARGRFTVRGTVWTPLDEGPSVDATSPVYAAFPTEGTVSSDAKGVFSNVRVARPGATDLSEARAFARSLTRHGQILGTRRSPGSAATHEIAVDDQGRRKLVRKRFSAF